MINFGNTNIIDFKIGDTQVTKIYQGSDVVWELSSGNDQYVDLGLPSGTLWATGNIVKNTDGTYSIGEPTDYGAYFSWGNIDGHNEGERYNFNGGTYNSTPGASLTADIASDDATHDAALARLGSPWRLPTKEECWELYDNCTSEWVTENGVNGRRFTSKTNGNSIFFPAAGNYVGTSLSNRGLSGFYWSASRYDLYFYSSSVYPQNYSNRSYGFPVRAVQSKPSTKELWLSVWGNPECTEAPRGEDSGYYVRIEKKDGFGFNDAFRWTSLGNDMCEVRTKSDDNSDDVYGIYLWVDYYSEGWPTDSEFKYGDVVEVLFPIDYIQYLEDSTTLPTRFYSDGTYDTPVE